LHFQEFIAAEEVRARDLATGQEEIVFDPPLLKADGTFEPTPANDDDPDRPGPRRARDAAARLPHLQGAPPLGSSSSSADTNSNIRILVNRAAIASVRTLRP
jgi:hypothetical protein